MPSVTGGHSHRQGAGQSQADHDHDQAPVPAAASGLREEHLDLSAAGAQGGSAHVGTARGVLLRAYHGTTMTSTMLEVNLDRTGPLALHDQVAAQIRRAIAEGEAGPGERLPQARDLAAVLGVNKNTVLRALHVLRDEGLLEFRRGRGITVAGTPQRGAVISQVRNLIQFAERHGYGRDELIQMIRDLPQDA